MISPAVGIIRFKRPFAPSQKVYRADVEKLSKIKYRYMYLKTYAKITFCIKSQGHVSDESFLYYCMHLASKISSYGV